MKRRTFEITVAGLIVATALICVALWQISSRDETFVIPLPPVTTMSEDPGDGAPGGADVISVSADTVQAVIATLARPSVYARDMMVERYWTDGNSVTNLRIEVRDGTTLLRTTSGGTEKNVLAAADATYIWYSGDREPYVYDGGATTDAFSMIVTYEDIFALRPSEIIDAAFIAAPPGAIDSVGEIMVVYSSGELGYVTECRVSIRLGLLVGAEVYDGDTLIYRMTVGATDTENVAVQFRLPNGRIVE